MADLNKVVLIGRLTRDVEVRVFANGGKVAKFGFVVSGGGRKDPDTGKWESEPCFLDVECYNRGEKGTLADRVEQYLSKGAQVAIDGKLKMDSWVDREGQKRNKIKVEAHDVVFLDARQKDGEAPPQRQARRPEGEPPPTPAPTAPEQQEDIPF